ncbi:hypothetical protein Tco_0274980, partial [Tanacetum coccineum]
FKKLNIVHGFVVDFDDVHSRIEDLLDTLSTLLSDNSPLSKDDSPRFALSMQIDSSVRYR